MKKSLKRLEQTIGSRSFRIGGYSLLAALLVIAIAVAVNLAVDAVPARLTKLDTSENRLFTISRQTEDLLAALPEDVTIYWVVRAGQEDDTVSLLLDAYQSRCGRLSVVKKDPDAFPGFVQQYTDTVTDNSLIVESSLRSRYVDYTEIYLYEYGDDYWYTGSYSVSFNGESAITTAIDYVCAGSIPKLYLLSGHGEATVSDTVKAAIQKENMQLETLELMTALQVPEDADALLLMAPKTDLSERETKCILEYLDAGGCLFLMSQPAEDDVLPNLQNLTEHYGVSAVPGIVVESGGQYYAWDTPYYLLPSLLSHSITEPLLAEGYRVLLPIAQGIRVADSLPENVSVQRLLLTSSGAYSKQAGYHMETYEREEGDLDGSFALGVAIEKTLDGGQNSRIVWVSSAYLLEESTDESVSGANMDFFLNSLNWLCEQEESSITIRAKDLSYSYLTISSALASLLSILLVGVLPLCYLAIGIVRRIRRNRQ